MSNQQFIRIATIMFPAERIENIDLAAKIGTETGVSVKLWDVPDAFNFTGQYANVAYDQLANAKPAPTAPPATQLEVVVNGLPRTADVRQIIDHSGDPIYSVEYIGNDTICLDDIQWIDFAAQIGKQTGVELRLATDATGITHQFTGDDANEAYDLLSPLAEEMQQVAR